MLSRPVIVQIFVLLSCCDNVLSWTTSLANKQSLLHSTATTTTTTALQVSSRVTDTVVASSAPLLDKPVKGCVVTVNAALIPEGDDFVPDPLFDGIVYDKLNNSNNIQYKQLQFVLGHGNYLPGLHDIVMDMRVGESVKDVSVDAGWGQYNPQLVATLPLSQLRAGCDPSLIKVDTHLQLNNGLNCVVTEVTSDFFTIDCNPPLAGTSYLAHVDLVKAEPGLDIQEYGAFDKTRSRFETAVFGLGCFWGGELLYMREPGVVGTAVGYTQGHVVNPTYEQVCAGTTGHTEAIAVTYDPDIVSYEKLVKVAMKQLGDSKYLTNQVGNDKGTQYRHGVYYATPEQGEIAKAVIESYGPRCVTEVKQATKFYHAEDYHQQFLLKGGQSSRKMDKSTIRCYG